MKELGLNAKELSQLSPERIFFRLTDALNAMNDPLRRSQMGFEVFGDNWRQISPLIESGSDGIRELMLQGQKLGRSLTGEQAAAAAEYTDVMNELRSVLQGIEQDVALKTIPAITKLARAIRFSLMDTNHVMRELEMNWLDFAEGFFTVFGGTVGPMLGPLKTSDGTPIVLQDIQSRRNQLMAKQLSGIFGQFTPDVGASISSAFRGSGNSASIGAASAAAGAGAATKEITKRLHRIYNEIPFTGNARPQGVFPALQANQSRLMRFGNELSPAIGQGQKVLNRMEKLEKMWEEFINGGKPPLPVKVENEPGIEMVKVN